MEVADDVIEGGSFVDSVNHVTDSAELVHRWLACYSFDRTRPMFQSSLRSSSLLLRTFSVSAGEVS